MSLSEVERALAAARGITEATGALHEAQVLQLKLWGALLFAKLPRRGGWVLEVDQDERQVTYRALKPWRPGRAGAKAIEALGRSVEWLLGSAWQLRVAVGDNLVHVGKQTTPNVNEQRSQRVNSPRSSGR